ncbi:hypothetical protein X880_4289 [Burkholderia pseudomallei MSHR4032]|uniref:hypothetical protein n=1 Tax=Burkholderia pseudomallei TaxID=28450 RepID=UPI000537A12E|nr:hypothetical protein [Burkholderia pseudomallei]KGU91538.1 hypothetical protein X880_4289 [Burkholderia pseudomallei MSHR4032]
MSDFIKIAKVAAQIDWQWDGEWWVREASRLGFKHEKSSASLEVHADPDGNAWRARVKEGKILFIEITFEKFVDVESLSVSEYEDKVDEFFARFEAAVAELTPALGKPVFSDGAAAKGFPDDQEANWLALWHVKNARLMLEQKHESQEFPFRLCFVIAPA